MRNEERAARSELDWRFALDPRPSPLDPRIRAGLVYSHLPLA